MENTMTYLGIDIGGTKVALRAENGTRSQETVFPWPSPESTAHDDLAALATQVHALLAATPGPVTSVGIAMPATVDGAGRVTTWPNRPSWTGLDLRGALHPLFPGSEVAWADDGDLAALAEADAAGCRNLVYLGVGTGIGGGMVVDGRPCPGPDRGSCEVGHMIVDSTGPRCDCGRRGCAQAIASGPATLRRAARLRGTTTTFADLGQGLRDDEPWAVAAVQESCAALAVVVVNLNELTHPSLALIGGGFADGLPGFTDRVAAAATALSRPGHRLAPVRAAALGGLSSLRGALLLARGTHSGYGVPG
ncbi:kanosamine kinase [Streptomyces lomondensis]|uniref:Kanosamine kinase n=2 Tax=Streptomyces lomondensis TaxID=68229 RepID=A0ABQ2X3X8_9ACTN|nr:kanosamine kinase [Streptomyces lomondensis]